MNGTTEDVFMKSCYTGCIKKGRQIRIRSLFSEAPQCTMFCIKIDCFDTYNVE